MFLECFDSRLFRVLFWLMCLRDGWCVTQTTTGPPPQGGLSFYKGRSLVVIHIFYKGPTFVKFNILVYFLSHKILTKDRPW